MIPVIGFAVYSQYALADRLLSSIDFPVEHLVIINNSGTKLWQPTKPENVENLWHIEVPYGLGLVGAWNLIVKTTPYAPYWLLVNDDAYFEPGALKVIAEHANPAGIGHPTVAPKWTSIVLGEEVVKNVGLYDERFYPLYFDDNDYEWRCEQANVPQYEIPAGINHDNSASLMSEPNRISYANNNKLFASKQQSNDTSWSWTLDSRRANRWD